MASNKIRWPEKKKRLPHPAGPAEGIWESSNGLEHRLTIRLGCANFMKKTHDFPENMSLDFVVSVSHQFRTQTRIWVNFKIPSDPSGYIPLTVNLGIGKPWKDGACNVSFNDSVEHASSSASSLARARSGVIRHLSRCGGLKYGAFRAGNRKKCRGDSQILQCIYQTLTT